MYDDVTLAIEADGSSIGQVGRLLDGGTKLYTYNSMKMQKPKKEVRFPIAWQRAAGVELRGVA